MEKFQKLPFDNREIDWRILVQDHITAANYGIAGALGTAPPAGFLSGDKSKVLQAMKDSFAHFRNAIVALNDADTAKPQKKNVQSRNQPARFLHHHHGTFW